MDIEENISKINEHIERVKEYLEYGMPYSEYLDLQISFETILNELEKKDKIINQMVIYIMTHSSVPTLRHRFCPNYEREECKYNCDDTKVKSKCIIEYFTNKVEEDK